MNNTNQHHDLSQTANANAKECWWMQGGVVDYKLCDHDYDCEHCPFDEALHGGVTTVAPDSRDYCEAGPHERDWTGVKKARKDATYVQGCEIVSSLFYHPAHTWARIEAGGSVRTGLDDFARQILGRPYLITLPEPDATLCGGEGGWNFTHQAGVSTLAAPVSGRVKEVNLALVQQPTLISRDPYDEGWALLIEPTDLKGSLKQLLYGPKVTQWYEREFERLSEKVNELSNRSDVAGPTMNDGGSLNENFRNALTADQLRRVIDYFFPLSLFEKAETNKAILGKHGGESW